MEFIKFLITEVDWAITGVIGFFAGQLLTRKNELKDDVAKLIDRVELTATSAQEYWTKTPSPEDIYREAVLSRDLQYISTEMFRIKDEYKIFSSEKLVRYNAVLLELVTNNMSPTRARNVDRARKIGRTMNYLIMYLKNERAKKNRFWPFK